MRLAAPKDVLDTLNIQVSAGTLSASGAALDNTFYRLATSLETDLVSGSWVNFFSVNSVYYPFKIRLSCSYITEDSVEVRVNSSGFSSTDLYSGDILDSSLYDVDYEKGMVSIKSGLVKGVDVLLIKFDAGFTVDSVTKVLKNVPEDLKTAHISLAASYMQINPAMLNKEKAQMARVFIRGYNDQATAIIQNRHRQRHDIEWPSFEHKEI